LVSNPENVWASALLATALIGILPIAILFFIPLTSSEEKTESGTISINHSLLKSLLSFAVGGLLGDVFLHLLPHAIESKEHENSHSHQETAEHRHDLSIGFLILFGILTFFIVEKLMRIRNGDSHSHKEKPKQYSAPVDISNKVTNKRKNLKNDVKNSSQKEKKENNRSKIQDDSKKVTGYLNIIADTAHNFTDGMAIAASFLISPKVGFSTTVAVFFHEIPHEIGDYAILIQSGFTKNKAMLVQLWTAFGAIGGCIVGLIAGGYVESVNWVLPFTAGGFIYIAVANVIPELLEDSSIKQTIKELFGIGIGISMMTYIALNE